MPKQKLLVDTHYLIWDLMGHDRFSSKMDKLLRANTDNCYFSPISYWEIGMLVGKKRITLPVTIEQFFEDLTKKRSYKTLPINAAIGDITRRFSNTINGDPADRIIVATAMAYEAQLITQDQNLLSLPFVESIDI